MSYHLTSTKDYPYNICQKEEYSANAIIEG
jgi:hypothetical protein